jgi:type VI secretion system protein ImpK
MLLVDTLIPVIALVRQTLSAPVTPNRPPASASRPAALPVTAAVVPRADANPFAPAPVAALASQTMDVRPPAPASAAPAVADTKTQTPETTTDGATQARALSNALDRQIEAARQNARDQNFVPSDFETALFAVLAWADESLITAPWAGAPYWQRHLLQRHHFNTTTAGVLFYTKLEDLREDQIQVREVYALCLSLGFKGRYAQDHLVRQLDERRRTTVQQVLDKSGLPAGMSALLFPGAYESTALPEGGPLRIEPAARRKRWNFRRQTIIGFGLPVLVLAVLYLTYHLIIIQMVSDILPKIQ